MRALQAGEIGRNSRLDEIQAAVLRTKLEYLEEWNLRRVALAKMYFNQLSHLDHRITLPAASAPGAHVYHLFVVQHEDRDGLRIETMVRYPFLLHQQPLFFRPEQRPLPVAEDIGGRVISLPLYPQLKIDDLLAVSKSICEFEG